jgi:hypothetical protein
MSTSVLRTAGCFCGRVDVFRGRIVRGALCFSWSYDRLSKKICSIALTLMVFVSSATFANARVINEKDLAKISEIKTIFDSLTNDIAQSLKRAPVPSPETDCLKSIQQDVVQTSDELSSYQYLLALVGEMDDFGDDASLRNLVRFALDKSIAMLDNERKRLSQTSDECVRFPLSVDATQHALQFIDLTSEALKSIRPRF